MSESQLNLPVDLKRLHDISQGNTVIIQQIADDYFVQATDIVREIDQAIQDQSIDTIKRMSHKLKGSSATIGVTNIRSSIEKMEQSVLASDFISANQALRDTIKNLEEARIFIKTYLV